ncbi:MAG: transglutaminase family protein [Planctomycetia bacterium]|nr:transglutaminase family protein [Planctomycetia bacterium]
MTTTTNSVRCRATVLGTLGVIALAVAGCAPQAPVPAGRTRLVGREVWDVYYIGGERIGYGSARWQADATDPSLIAASGTLRLEVKRFGQESVSEVKMRVVETAASEVRSFHSEARLGPTPAVVDGRLEGAAMAINVTSGDRTAKSSLPWTKDCGGYFAVEEHLLAAPMKPGEHRTLRALMPIFNQVAEVELVAADFEQTKLLDGSRDLLRIDTTTKLPGAEPIKSTTWTDRNGESLKTFTPAMNQVTYRTSRERALARGDEPRFDIGAMSVVALARPIDDAHQARQLRYRVRLEDGDPARSFVSDLSQQVTPIDARTADVVVRAVRPDDPPAGQIPKQPAPVADDAAPNSFIQSDDARIKQMAQEAAGNESDPWRTAIALERYVHDKIANKNYSQTFATAAEVARSLEGDCTEHAVLLAALARAGGFPARVAIGLVYMPAERAFGFHMWTEVWIGDRWIGIDGTLGREGIGAGHLKLATSSLKDATAYSSFLTVANVLGRLRIDVPQQAEQ